ncbi:MAG: hypothetical protein IK096_06040, partial [Lachnospiraceae bacterium]|nr:hypothetical protein [Lachnospiraceae bacterium]
IEGSALSEGQVPLEDSEIPAMNADAAGMDDWRYVLSRLAAGSIHPSKLITHRLPLAELERGLLIMRDKTEDYCKVMVC